MNQQFFATAALGLEPLLATELQQLGCDDVKEERAGVRFSGHLRHAYSACLWSRLASRILMPLAEFPAQDTDQLYAAVLAIDWSEHLDSDATLAVDCSLVQSAINHSRYAALRVKDAIVDQFMQQCGVRPSVDVERPDVRLNLYIHRNRGVLSLDLSGASLHKRGYRIDGVSAPLKENLAAAILLRAGWPDICAEGGALLDPMCGSGSLPLEAALIALDIAPGLLRDYYGFNGWKKHDIEAWTDLLADAMQRRDRGMERSLPLIAGYDSDRRAIKAAWQHAEQAGIDKMIHFERRTLREFSVPTGAENGLVVANPPYGERLGNVAELGPLYNLLGEKLVHHCAGWKAAVITSEPQLGRSIGLRAGKINRLYNGALKCQLLQFSLDPSNRWKSLEDGAGKAVKKPLSAGAEMFANRLRKNLKKYSKWAKREGLDCYRLYDADLPEYAVAVDLYGDEVHLQEYRAPKEIEEHKAAARLKDVRSAVPLVLDVAEDKIHLKIRQQQRGAQKYQKREQRGILKDVREGNCRLLVNLSDYLDTGLPLNHRSTRELIQQMATGKSFLNLFAYTGSATVHALIGGAITTTSIDMSRASLQWTEKNIALNDFDPEGQKLIQADCLSWIAQATQRFDLIFLDPPTFSNSKSMDGTFDLQRDHVELLGKTVALLNPGGVLIFSNNLRRFEMDMEALPELAIDNISATTLPFDFERRPRIHNCWKIMRREDAV